MGWMVGLRHEKSIQGGNGRSRATATRALLVHELAVVLLGEQTHELGP